MATQAPEQRDFGVRGARWWPVTAPSWLGMAFVIAFVLAIIVIAVFGAEERGTELALRVTARWSFLLFWPAYVGSAMALVFGQRFDGLARRGRELGLAFASAQLVHVGLVLWLYHIAAGPGGAMVFFWLGILCTYLLALFSLPWLHGALGPRLWRLFRTIALEYIALAFATDFILGPLHAKGLAKFPLTYLPFVLMLVGGAGLRIATFSDQKLLHLRENLLLGPYGLPRVSQCGGTSRVDRQIFWPLLIFVGAILILLILDDALLGFMEAALALYGPPIVLFGAYVLLKLAILGTKFIGSQFK
jgi:hypothetical protein